MRKAGEKATAEKILRKEEIEEMERHFNECNQDKLKQEIQEDRKRIEALEYWEWLPEVEGGRYWNDKKTEGWAKEIWARIRTGNISV